ncbi:MAG: hypothetical protein Q4E73_06940 [Lachnospiraceae bacterium]|nr:hypothetical protein [Lachnospiraceae bacterium]
MSKAIKTVTIFSCIITIFSMILFYHFHRDIYLTASITFATTTYHFGMRLLIGLIYEIRMKNRADYTKKWYQLHSWERKLYKFCRVKTWKNKLPTYSPENFSPKYYSWNEIAQAMCQAELVHETIIVFSFLPLFASARFGAFYVFLITSVCAALFDLMFVMIQRYNRDRVMKILLRKR